MSRTIAPPKNGTFHTALLVGCSAELARKLRAKLMADRILLVTHHVADHAAAKRLTVPATVDIAILTTDIASHWTEEIVVPQCEALGIPVVRTLSRTSFMYPALSKLALHRNTAPKFAMGLTGSTSPLLCAGCAQPACICEMVANRELSTPAPTTSTPPQPIVQVKTCATCGKTKGLDAFGGVGRYGAKMKHCRPCWSAIGKANWAKEKAKRAALLEAEPVRIEVGDLLLDHTGGCECGAPACVAMLKGESASAEQASGLEHISAHVACTDPECDRAPDAGHRLCVRQQPRDLLAVVRELRDVMRTAGIETVTIGADGSIRMEGTLK